ncbi:MAG: CPBP family intramembrane metalloprotease, partial [Bacteroidales bacterium]|nr:CPBP family intramembrane metalloprotease [Bacteroidales bacterium]
LRWGANCGFIVTTAIYTLVHVASFNFMLIMAAMVCGVFWSLMYSWKKNLLPLIISHALWDVTVFIVFPIA